MPKKQIHFRIDEDIMNSSENLRDTALTDDKDLVLFKLHTGSQNAWLEFIFSMGVIKVKEEFEKFKRNIENETENKDNKKYS